MKKIFTLTIYLFCFIILHAQPGAFDTTFANKGKFVVPESEFPNPYVGPANATVITGDGKIIMIGYGLDYSNPNGTFDFAVIRLNPNGTMDSSFGTNGKVFIDFSTPEVYSTDYGYALTLQEDGKIVVVGYANDYYYNDSANTYNIIDIGVARLNTDGSLDNSFDGDGKKLIDLSALTGNGYYSYDYGYGVAINSHNKICIMGDTYVDDGVNNPNYDAFVLELNSDGSFNNNFDDDGIDIINRPQSDEFVYGFSIQSDNKFLLGGIIGEFSNYQADILVIRLNINGSTDNNFDGDGFAEIDLGGTYDYGNTVITQSDGKILASAGQTNGYDGLFNFVVVRLNTNGSLDNSFNGNGIRIYGQPNEYNAPNLGLALQADGKIIQVGGVSTVNNSNYTGSGNFIVLRYNSDGSVDDGFGNHGRAVIDFGNWSDNVNDGGINCVIQPDGKIIGVGVSNGIAAATRLLIDGKLITLSGPSDQTGDAAQGECSVTINNIDPILDPPVKSQIVNYALYGATIDSGVGTLSGKQFNIGTTTAVYSLASNPLQRAYFNVTATGGTRGGALDFDGVNDYVDLGYMNPLSSGNYGQYSFEAWIKVRGYTNDDGLGSFIFGNERNFNGGIQVELDTSGYITTFYPSAGFVRSSYKVPLHTWTHIAFVQSNSELTLYVNGNFVQTLLSWPNLHSNDYDDFLLGAFSSDFVNFTRHFNGQMDEVRVWDYAICPAQIQNNMNCEISGIPQGLIAYYKFNQGVASCSNLSENILNNELGYPNGMLMNFALAGSKSNWVKGHVTGTCTPFTPLTLTCPDPITINLDPGQCSAIANFSATAVSGCGSNVTITYSQDPGTYFSSGTTYVYVNATDDLGNTASCSFTVTLTETEPPVLITKDTTIALNSSGSYVLSPYDVIKSVSDNCSLYTVYTDPFYLYFDCNSLGAHTVNVFAADNSGNLTTGTATITIAPFVTTSFVTVSPAPVQYSDVATLTAGIIGAESFYFNGCAPATEVTFKLGQTVLGTVSLTPDNYGNLIATLNKQMTKGFIDSLNYINTFSLNADERKVVAIFKGGSTEAVKFKQNAFTELALAKEDAQFEYTGSQIINTKNDEVALPVSVRITDNNDGYKGDISNANVTFTIEPVTPGTSIAGPDSITVSTISFLNKDKTSGIAQAKFKVSTGGKLNAKFRVTAKGGNYYKGKISVPVIISRSATSALPGESITSSISKQPDVFDVTAMPNPSHTYFKLEVQSPDKFEKLSIRIMDIAGRVIESKSNVAVDETIQLGEQYKAGTYMVEVKQGQNIKVIKLVKL
jgi:uncharacterized delta-60 repeat protein